LTFDADVTVLALSPDGQYLATGTWDKVAQVWETAHIPGGACLRAREITRLRSDQGIVLLSFSADNKRLMTTGWDNVSLEWLWQRDDLTRKVCADLNNLTLKPDEWKRYVGDAYESPSNTCSRTPDQRKDLLQRAYALLATFQ
jgi:WD40 repeat protein